tara:strand:+ start:1523 stop:3439 length:1917 start_codon:yes stop_codon:yes gene_type:complete
MSDRFKYQLSVIIVNYNVEYFLNQCLDAVKKASKNLQVEVIIVDNHSVDGSLKMLKEKYPEHHLIANKDNVGFSTANNQGIKESSGEYVLLLNPDTVVAESTLEKVVAFMNENKDAGGLGVRMIDGKGIFLPESKRGLPTPTVAFYKIFGLSKIFPRSKKYNQYHAGHVDEFETNEVDILSGAFMLIRKDTLDNVGLLDEDFFMYGEDIDLSYRIQLGGYKNYYFADTKIIHYKGESTKKNSVNYVFVFYNAMIIFAKKHFKSKNAKLFTLLINLAIYLRATIDIVGRFVKKIILPSFDLLYITFGLYALTNYWGKSQIEFAENVINYSIPLYALTWLGSALFNGGYDLPAKLSKLFKGIFWGTILILLVYAILPKSLQFSRLFIFLGAAWTMGYYFISRMFLHVFIKGRFSLKFNSGRHFSIIGNQEEFERIKKLITQTNSNVGSIKKTTLENNERVIPNEIDELIFSTKNHSYEFILNSIDRLKSNNLDFKIAPKNAEHLIGSNSIDTTGDLYLININALVSKENVRKKRLFDICFSTVIFLMSPILFLVFNNKIKFFSNILKVFIGTISFIGFSEETAQKDVRLPTIKNAILTPSDGVPYATKEINEKLNLLYARDYSLRKDLAILLNAWRKLDT